MHIYAFSKKNQIAQCTSGLWGNSIWGLFLVHRFIPGRRVERKNVERESHHCVIFRRHLAGKFKNKGK